MICLTAYAYCKDDISKIENYEQAVNDKEHVWHCHHRLELTLDGEFAHSRAELRRLDMYLKRPYFELIFLKSADHRKLHKSTIPDKTRAKLADSAKRTWTGRHHSAETKAKMSKTRMGHAGYNAKKRAFTDGVKNIFAHECPAGFRPGWTWNPETRIIMAQAHIKEKMK